MKRLLSGSKAGAVLAALALSASCHASQNRESKPDPAPEAAAPAPPVASGPQGQAASAPLGAPLQTGGPGPLSLPPAPGRSRTSIQGCLASSGAEESGARSTAPPAARAPGPPSVAIAVSGLGATVKHELSHACCLKAEVESAVKGSSVTVDEKLSGTPCRCMCSSTLTTAVGLSPGVYELTVRLQLPGGAPSEVHREKVEIKRLGR